MSERARNAREIRIVPGTPGQPAARTPMAAPSAVQIFRSLAAQASAFANGIAPRPYEPQTTYAPLPDGADQAVSGDTEPLHETAAAPTGAAGRSCSVTAEGPAEHGDQPAAAAPRRAAAAPAAAKESGAQHDDAALGEHIVRTCATAAHGEFLAQQLADRISRFCAMSGTSDDAAWEVSLPMNPAVLVDTLLHLQLSPARIAIRFETSDTRSARLIYDNADTLRARLSEALRRQIDVEVAV